MKSNQMKCCPFVHSSVIDASSFGTQQLIDYVTQIRALVKEADVVKSRDVLVVTNIGIGSVSDQNQNSPDKTLIVMGDVVIRHKQCNAVQFSIVFAWRLAQ
jgi:hypothetical protein